MTSPPASPLCDRNALLRNRRRSRDSALFLHEEARAEIEDRLSVVNREFTAPAIVTGHSDYWSNTIPEAKIVEDSDILPFQPQAHDLVIHAMCLHWANDPVGQLIQCRRALKPDGLLLAILPGGETLHELRACLAQAETAIRGGLSPRVLPMGDLRDLGALLQRAGFALPVADSISLRAEYDDIFALMRDLRRMGEGNALFSRDKRLANRKIFETADGLFRAHFPGATKPICATYELVSLTGWAPSESQPQPLRPGSAQARLAEALGTKESPLHD